MFILEINLINYSNLNVKLTDICFLEQEQFDLKRKITINKMVSSFAWFVVYRNARIRVVIIDS
jgi:hypothetical protein